MKGKRKEELTRNETTRSTEYSTFSILYLAFELGNEKWKLGFTIGLGQRPRQRTINAADLAALEWEIQRAKKRFGFAETMQVMSCYEAGRDGFWLHRYTRRRDTAGASRASKGHATITITTIQPKWILKRNP